MNLIPPSISHLTFASINCNSLNMSEQSSIHHLIKLYGVVKLKTDIIFMSDIRLCNARGISNSTKIENSFLTNPYCSYRFLSQSSSNKRGVGILIKQKLNLSILQEERDPEDNYLALRVSTGAKEIIIGSIYGPNTHNPGFFDRLSESLIRLGDVPIVIGGDWNCTYSALPIPDNPDVLNMRSLPNKRHTDLLLNLCTNRELIDPFRARFTNRKEFSYSPSDPLKRNRSRIDFFLVSTNIMHNVTEVGINASKQNKMFDHSAVTLSFVPLAPTCVNRPTISNLILKDPDLDLVVALSVADTYLSCTAINAGIDKIRLKTGVGSSFKKLRELGVSEEFLV
jgi:exonuclease III